MPVAEHPSLLSAVHQPLAHAASLSYGGDAAGLICGYLLAEGSAPQELDSAQAAQWLAEQRPHAAPTAFLWLHFNLSHAQAVRWMQQHASLPEAFFETLKDRSVSTRIERDDDTLIAVLNDAHFDFAFEPSDIATLWTCVAPHLMVTGRTRPLRSVDALRTAMRAGSAPTSSVGLLAELMARDAADKSRPVSPLVQAPDAALLDTSDLGIEPAFAAALALVSPRIESALKDRHRG